MKILLRMICLSLVLFIISTVELYSQGAKVRIISEQAVLRLAPSNDSIEFKKLPLGSEFGVEETVGDWIKIMMPPDADGLVIAGYVHKSFVEFEIKQDKTEQQIKPLPEEPIRKEVPINKDLSPKSRKAEEGIAPGNQLYKRAELSISIGGGFFGLDSSSIYSDSGSMYLVTSFDEESVLNMTSENGIFFGGSMSYFINKNLGIQASIGSIQSKVPSKTTFDFRYTWNDGRSYSHVEHWDGNGDLSSVPLSFNLIGRFGEKPATFYLSGGYTLFSNKLRADSYMGMVLSDVETDYIYGVPYYTQYIDGLKVPVTIDESWTSSGFNIGGGLDFKLSANVAFNIDGRYYACPSKELGWTYVTGDYDGLYGEYTWTVGSDEAEVYGDATSPLDVGLSFFKISAGIKFFF